VPSRNSKRSPRRSRKRRNPGAAPRAVPSTRRELRATREVEADRAHQRAHRRLGREGERPPGPFGGLPISELAILAGFVGVVVGVVQGGGAALIVGIVVCALGVVEVTAREHFSGFRSHSALLALIPAVAVEAGVVAVFGEPRQRALLLLVAVPVFGGLFWLLRRRFQTARQARVARPQVPRAPAS
jgi:hypothetical protein